MPYDEVQRSAAVFGGLGTGSIVRGIFVEVLDTLVLRFYSHEPEGDVFFLADEFRGGGLLISPAG